MRAVKTLWLRRAVSVLENHPAKAPRFSPTRRNFIRNTSTSAIGMALLPGMGGLGRLSHPRIAIIGGGLAGLSCAWKLKKAGYNPVVFEASNLTGGRTMTVHNFQKAGTVHEIGGEYFTSDHRYVIRLARQLSKKVYTSSAPNRHLKPLKAFFGNREVSLRELEQSLLSFREAIAADIEDLPELISWEKSEKFGHLDSLSIAQYLKSKGIDELGYRFLTRAFTIENGMEADQQSALNLLLSFREGFTFRPSEKIRSLRIKGGNQSLCTELASRMWKSLRTRHRLVNLHQHTDWYTLYFDCSGREKKFDADIVVLAIPFSVFRKIETNVHFNERKQLAINELGYGQKDRMLLGFVNKPWCEQGYEGLTYSDELFGYGSDHLPRQKGKNQVLSVKPAGREAGKFARMDTANAAMRCLSSFDK
ncbi:MAG TPA: FAD-binding protein, partial [Bacteroidetes bacterium]|nr:FAD-binding protein [Bacteroidota bacterium]